MNMQVHGLHHVTAIAGDPQANVDFYTGVLGLRLVKVTVNYDDPQTYHLYYGDDRGHPGTILTFFPWPGAPRGRTGTGQVTVTAFAISHESVGFWVDRLRTHEVEFAGPSHRFDEEVIALRDPDGLQLELVTGASGSGTNPRPDGTIPGKNAIQRFQGVTMTVEGFERTAALLTATLGFGEVGAMGNRFRYTVGEGDGQGFVGLLCLPSGPSGRVAVGTAHHIAWRTPDDEAQRAWRAKLAGLGYNVTLILDRSYFHSIYFREPGGVLSRPPPTSLALPWMGPRTSSADAWPSRHGWSQREANLPRRSPRCEGLTARGSHDRARRIVRVHPSVCSWARGRVTPYPAPAAWNGRR